MKDDKTFSAAFLGVMDKLSDALMRRSVVLTALGIVVFGMLVGIFFVSAPAAFPQNTRIVITEGSSLRQVAETLKSESVIRSPLMFQAIVHFEDREHTIRAGTYLFPERLSVFGIARSLITGEYKMPLRRVTVFEGMDNREIAALFAHELEIDPEKFLTLAEEWEGYLFPETYFIPEEYTEEDIIELMRTTFEEKMVELQDDIADSGLSLHELIVLASIIEGEAREEISMRMVAGILFNRLAIDMPLQVDAVFVYLLGKGSSELTIDDLAIDSPYNTYTNIGLPPTPIANPGLASIEAVLNPTPSDYLYYLTAPNGVFHYAETFEVHKRNKELHL